MMRFRHIGLMLLSLGMSAWAETAEVLPGTQPLLGKEDLSEKMMDGAHRFVERKIAESQSNRQKYWNRDFSSPEAYQKSVEPNREHLKKIIGVVDARVPVTMEFFGEEENPARVFESSTYSVDQVRWQILEGVYGEGLLLRPQSSPQGYVVALPDADQTPEQIAGLAEGVPPAEQYARRLVENGFVVIVPVLIDRADYESAPGYPKTKQTNREWIYRQAFHMGRHIIGYEVQKALSAVDWLKSRYGNDVKVGAAGYGEGGLIAFYATAVDLRIDAAWVSGYFGPRQRLWSEPIYRNVWSFLCEFGDAEVASLIAPRGLVIEYSSVPEVLNQKGELRTPRFSDVLQEFQRIDTLTHQDFQPIDLISGAEGELSPIGSAASLQAFVRRLGVSSAMGISDQFPADNRRSFKSTIRQKRQVKELEHHVQELVRQSENVRNQFFLHRVMPQFAEKKWLTVKTHETYSPDKFIQDSRWFRQYFSEEAMGKFDEPLLPFNPRTRKIYDTEKWVGYDVVLDVWPEVFAWGILLVPKDIKPGDRRPVVVCQHGRQGLPQTTIESGDSGYYGLAAVLADQGFVTFSPHNMYRGEDRYRWLSRKANGVKASLFSFIISQHDQILQWLETLPFVDGKRMAFYGKSYGGETAMRVPAILERYALSICCGDFNQWTRKVTATDQDFSFMYTIEWEMPYFNLGSTFDYAEMAYLIFPRPFMVERGHHDLVGRDSWVAYEYAKVRWLYTQFALPERTEIEFFNGGHAVNGVGTFQFLHRFLHWPEL